MEAVNDPQHASPLPAGQAWVPKQTPLASGTSEMLRQCQPMCGLVQRRGQQEHFLTSLRSVHPSQARSHRQPKVPPFPESPAARGQPVAPARPPGSPGTPRLGACVSVRLSPLAIFQESRRDLRAADSAG